MSADIYIPETLSSKTDEEGYQWVSRLSETVAANILSSEREPWLIIDPKGYYGDPGYEVGGYLANYPDKSCKGRDRHEIDISRVDIIDRRIGNATRPRYQMGIGALRHLGHVGRRQSQRHLARRHPSHRSVGKLALDE